MKNRHSMCRAYPLKTSYLFGFYWKNLGESQVRGTVMQSSKLSPGDSIEARCTKCRKNNSHTILSISETEDVPDKVQCAICSRQHKYRPPSAIKNPAVRRTGLLKDAERHEWETMRPGMNSAKATDYSMTDSYKIKALINHPTFGLGVVQRVVGSQKIEVLFEDGKKTMRCK